MGSWHDESSPGFLETDLISVLKYVLLTILDFIMLECAKTI